jgi:hypothetical protein
MADLNNYLATLLENVALRGSSLTGGELFLALFTANPTAAGGGTECSYSGYARISFGATPSTAWVAPSSNVTSNPAILSFAAIAGGPITITGVAIKDALTVGNFYLWKALASPIVYNTGDIPQVPVGGITITFS